MTLVPLDSVIEAIATLNRGRTEAQLSADREKARLRDLVIELGGLRKAARSLEVDGSNLSKRLRA